VNQIWEKAGFVKDAGRIMHAVICCDQAAPSELVRDALRVGSALSEKGHRVSYIAGDPIRLVESTGSWIPNDLYQAPVRRAGPNLVLKSPRLDGFADYMAAAGFDDKETLITMAALWNRQLLALRPDIIIGFYAPLSWLVGPSHAPTFALGSGLTLPPVLGASFPRFSVDSAPAADPHLMLDFANAALLRHGQQPLAAISDVVDRCISLLYGVPAFDPYLQLRKSFSVGLLGEEPTPRIPPVNQHLAALLDVYCPNIEQIILAIANLNEVTVDICVSGATTGMRRFLEQHPHVVVWNDYDGLLAEAANASALVHHGVQDVAQRAISLGRPQLIIPWTREQEMLRGSVDWMGISWYKHPASPLEELVGTFRGVIQEPSITLAAQHHARQLANTHLPNALPIIVEHIENSFQSQSKASRR
jgi:hypothetical protein